MVHRYALAFAVMLWLGGAGFAESAFAQRRRVNTVPGPAGVDPVTEVNPVVNPVVGPRRVRPVPGPAGLNNPVLLKTLPPNYQTVVVAGVTYYVANGVYYIYDPARQGYVVVVAPQ
ncbi:hypothetical protein [Synechococcus sp. C9]|uniref:hypothetical protein n=1 Tax=Synechococcus sp. C9 TaxID=102119 RepID=UPI001FF114ED|nr:hypothetical protein [Synechococcus sp. C9]